MAGERRRCENCWVWVDRDLDTCPNCSHPFPLEVPSGNKVEEDTPEPPAQRADSGHGRPFKFILFFLLSFIAVIAFLSAEGMSLRGRTDPNYLLGDLITLSLYALVPSLVFLFIDYIASYETVKGKK
jgi:hypothetical protein